VEQIYRAIEQKIKDAGFERQVNGADVYDDICEQIDDKEPGTYLCISKFFADVVFEYTIVVMEEEFNLSTLTIVEGEKRTVIDFDN
jgi:hypothetical protein